MNNAFLKRKNSCQLDIEYLIHFVNIKLKKKRFYRKKRIKKALETY